MELAMFVVGNNSLISCQHRHRYVRRQAHGRCWPKAHVVDLIEHLLGYLDGVHCCCLLPSSIMRVSLT